MAINENISFHEPILDIGTWRKIYLRFIDNIQIDSICEVGSGHPSFLNLVKASKKLAIDFGDDFEREFIKSNIDFLNLNLDNDNLEVDEKNFDAVVCSDVFEHLLRPERTLAFCRKLLHENGIFFSHVPNEFNFYRVLGVMFLSKKSVFFHKSEEQNNPHLRRFSNAGYLDFLENEFKYNLYISDINYTGIKKFFSFLKAPIPYGFQFGPTYISTNSIEKYEEIKLIKSSL